MTTEVKAQQAQKWSKEKRIGRLVDSAKSLQNSAGCSVKTGPTVKERITLVS